MSEKVEIERERGAHSVATVRRSAAEQEMVNPALSG